jgi:predicted enzyme related to lactoylglutathione lyase
MLSKSTLATLVPIKNMDRAVKFYRDVLGATIEMRPEGEMGGSFASLRIGDAEFWLVKPEIKEKRSLAYYAFGVEDIRKTVAGLQKKGVRFKRAVKEDPNDKVDGPITFSEWGASAFFNDSEGNLQMLWQDVQD